MPDEEYSRFSDVTLDRLLADWQVQFEENFGVHNMVYNVHLWVRMSSDGD